MNRPWIRAQVRRRAADIVGPDYDERTYIETVLDGLEADDITDVSQIPADELDRRINEQTLPPTPVFTRTDVPGIGRIDVFPGGRIELDGDIGISFDEVAELVDAVVRAGFAAKDAHVKAELKPLGVTTYVEEI